MSFFLFWEENIPTAEFGTISVSVYPSCLCLCSFCF
jgi:hypothetical protein